MRFSIYESGPRFPVPSRPLELTTAASNRVLGAPACAALPTLLREQLLIAVAAIGWPVRALPNPTDWGPLRVADQGYC